MKLPKLTEEDVKQWTDAGSFHRGQGYYQEGRILHPRRQGNILKAECFGSMPAPYRLQVTLNAGGIVSGTCSCPVGYACKHTVALLLTWIYEPETFTEQEKLDDALEKRSKAELVTLIKKMLDYSPELEDLLQIQALGEATSTQPIPSSAIHQQVTQAMSGAYEWGASYGISQTLQEIVATGDQYLQREDWRNAVTVYTATAQAILENYGNVYDDEGELLWPVGECVDGLGGCLASIEEKDLRETVLRGLFDILAWDVNYGGVGVSDEIPTIILEHATTQEMQQVADWVRAHIPEDQQDFSTNWRREVYGGFLLELEADQLDDEAYLRICRETGRVYDEVNRLLELERLEEAEDVARSTDDYTLLSLANCFVNHEQDSIAVKLISERTESSQDTRLKSWLQHYAETHDQPEQALHIAEELFWARPTLQTYQELENLATPLQTWEALRQTVLARLAKDPRYVSLRVNIYLAESEVALALDTFKKMANSSQQRGSLYGTYYNQELSIRVAQAAEADYPEDAIDLYMRAVHKLIDARGRSNYATAVQYLLRVQAIYKRLDISGRFKELVDNLRADNPRLRALKDELNKAGL